MFVNSLFILFLSIRSLDQIFFNRFLLKNYIILMKLTKECNLVASLKDYLIEQCSILSKEERNFNASKGIFTPSIQLFRES